MVAVWKVAHHVHSATPSVFVFGYDMTHPRHLESATDPIDVSAVMLRVKGCRRA